MARNEIRTDLTVNDQASDKLQDVADLGDRIESDPIEADVRVDTDQATRKIKDLGDTSDQSRSVLANLVGNSAQDLGELGGVAGTAGVALGQLAEYAADGNISLRGLVATAGPMLAIGVAVSFITKHFQEANERAEKLKETNRDIAESLRAGELDEAAGKIVEGYGDLIDQAEKAGVSAGDLTSFLTDQSMTMQELMASSTATGDEYVALAIAAGNAKESFREQSGELATNIALQDQVRGRLGDTSAAADDAARSTEELTAAYDELTGRLSDDAAYLDVQDAFDDVAAAGAEAFAAVAAGEAGAEQATRDHARSVIDLKQQVADYSANVAAIPPEQATEIIAMIDRGEFDAAEAALAQLERNRTAHLTLAIAYPNRPVGYPPNAPWPPVPTGNATTVNVNMPRGSRPADVIRSFESYARRNGGRVAFR